MKLFTILSLLLIGPISYAADCTIKHSAAPLSNFYDELQLDANKVVNKTLFNTREVDKKFARVLAEFDEKNKEKDKQELALELKMANGETRVFGLSESEVLNFDGDPNGAACSDDHNDNDLSNRWCHAMIVKAVQEQLKERGVHHLLSSVIGASVFVVKEYGYDKNPSMPDLVMADVEIYKNKKYGDLLFTIFGDGMFFLTVEKEI